MHNDEAIFYLKGSVQQLRYWVLENPDRICESKSQYNPRIKIWAGIIVDQTAGPFFFDQQLLQLCVIFIALTQPVQVHHIWICYKVKYYQR